MIIKKYFFIFLLFFSFLSNTRPKNLPIVLINGITKDAYTMKPTERFIYHYLPERYVKTVKIGEGKNTSYCNMYEQAEWLRDELQADPHLKNGCIIIGHSQGGLIARHFIQKYNNPRVYVFIGWAVPHRGIFGTPGNFDNRFVLFNYVEQFAYLFLYTETFQKNISFAGYWCDTLHFDDYLNRCTFLPYLNNEKIHSDAQLFKENICKLEQMVLVRSTQEHIIEPAISCHFGFYKKGSKSKFEDLVDSELFQQDWLGLKTLADTNRLQFKFTDALHGNLQEDEQNFLENTLPFLLDPEDKVAA